MTSLKQSSITSFFAAKPPTIAKKRKPQVIEIDADGEGPAEAVIVVDNVGTKKDNRLVDVTFRVLHKYIPMIVTDLNSLQHSKIGSTPDDALQAGLYRGPYLLKPTLFFGIWIWISR